jgi:hypothetical protein
VRRLVIVLCCAGLLAAVLTLVGSPAGAQTGEGEAGGPPRPAPAGTHWTYVASDRPEARPEVVGGTPATPGTFPYQVALSDPDLPGLNIRGQFCGGSLIAPDTVLTAAHCVVAGLWVLVGPDDQILDVQVDLLRPTDVDILAGDVDLGRDSAAERLDVRQIRVDPAFMVDFDATFNFFVPDVAILQLASASTTGTPVALAVPGQEGLYPAGTNATVSGWGNTGNALEAPPTILQQATLPIVADGECATAYGSDVDASRNLCAGDLADGLPTPCFGDSGGPLVIDDNGTPLQVGVVLGGDGCPAPERPAVFSRVAANADFVGRYLDPDEVPDRPLRVRASQRGATLRVSWRPPDFDGGTKITGYRVAVSGGVPAVTVGGSSRHVDVGLQGSPLRPGRTYTVKVRALNAVGQSAPTTRTVTIAPIALP